MVARTVHYHDDVCNAGKYLPQKWLLMPVPQKYSPEPENTPVIRNGVGPPDGSCHKCIPQASVEWSDVDAL